MKVHFIATREGLTKDFNSLQRISKTIKQLGHELVRDWLVEAHDQLKLAGQVSDNWGRIVRVNIEGIAKADVVIAECSFDSFAVGYQVSEAMQQKKPILLLRHMNADQDAFVTGVESGWIDRGEYDEKNLSDILKSFLDSNEINTKDMRFNFFIDRPIHNYLKWTSLRTGKTKAEIIRELLDKEIERFNSSNQP